MTVRRFNVKNGDGHVACRYTDMAGAHWCMKEIGNIKPCWFSKVFICSGGAVSSSYTTRLQRSFECKESTAALLTMNASITGEYATNWLFVRTERTSHSDRGLLSISSWTKRQCWRGKRKHYIGVSHHLSMKRVKSQESMNDPVPELKFVIDKHVDVGSNVFLIYDCWTDDPAAELSLVFTSFCSRQHAAIAIELYAGVTYRAASKLLRALRNPHNNR